MEFRFRLMNGLTVLALLIAVTGGAGSPSNADSPAYEGPRFTGERPDGALRALEDIQAGLNYAAAKARPAVVTIYVTREVQRRTFPFRFGPPGRERRVRGLGSGVIIRSSGYILTNHHVVKNVDRIKVLLHNQQRVSARIVGTDPGTDLAVLKVDRRQLPALEFADSDEVEVGDWALAVGSPFSLQNSVSFGHVSALHRAIQATRYENFIQTDAPINRGNSGGPLVNIEGEIIGINTLIQSTSGGNQGIGFASAANLARRTARDLIEHGEVRRAWMGVSIQQLAPRKLEEHFGADRGAVVSEVQDDSPADRAGLQAGDLIVSLDGRTIEDPGALQRRVIQHDPGEEVRVTVLREGERRTLTVTLGKRPAQTGARSGARSSRDGILSDLGVRLGTVSPKRARRWGVQSDDPVLAIKQVRRGSIAHRAGLRPNDLILTVNRRPLASVEAFRSYLQKAREAGRESVLLLVRRRDNNLFVTLPLPDSG